MSDEKKHVLLVEDDQVLGTVTKLALEKRGFHVELVQSVDQALGVLADTRFHIAVLDLKLEEGTSLPLLPELLAHNSAMKILVLTAYASIATAVEAVKRGATNYLPKPATVSEILDALHLGEQKPVDSMPIGKVKEGSKTHSDMGMMSTKRLEWEHIQRVLLKNKGNISATARELNMHRRTLQRKLQKHPVKE